jgi:hypothetical protein
LTRILVTTGSLSSEVGRLKDLWSFENFSVDGVRCQRNIETPLLDILALGDHVVQVADGLDPVVRLLEEILAHGSHHLFVFANFLGDSDQHAKLWGQIDILTLLLDFKQGLVEGHNLFVVLLAEVLHHGDGLTGLTLLEARSLRTHVPAHAADLVGFVVTVAGHHDSVLKLVVDSFLNFNSFWWFTGVALALLSEAHHLLIDKLKTVVDGEILADVVDDEVDSALEDP